MSSIVCAIWSTFGMTCVFPLPRVTEERLSALVVCQGRSDELPIDANVCSLNLFPSPLLINV